MTVEEREEVAAAPSHEDAGDVDDLVSALVCAQLISMGGNCTDLSVGGVFVFTLVLCARD